MPRASRWPSAGRRRRSCRARRGSAIASDGGEIAMLATTTSSQRWRRCTGAGAHHVGRECEGRGAGQALPHTATSAGAARKDARRQQTAVLPGAVCGPRNHEDIPVQPPGAA
eukprot:5945974-Prymnesium_polylepis.1